MLVHLWGVLILNQIVSLLCKVESGCIENIYTDSDGTGTIVFDGNPPGQSYHRLDYHVGEDDGTTTKRLKALHIKNDAALELRQSEKYNLSKGITTETDGKGSIVVRSDYDLTVNIGESAKRLKQITLYYGDTLTIGNQNIYLDDGIRGANNSVLKFTEDRTTAGQTIDFDIGTSTTKLKITRDCKW